MDWLRPDPLVSMMAEMRTAKVVASVLMRLALYSLYLFHPRGERQWAQSIGSFERRWQCDIGSRGLQVGLSVI